MHFLVFDSSRSHHDSLRDTISWESVVKDDRIRSCLIELKSYLFRKFDVSSILFACTKQDAVHSGQFDLDLYVPCSLDPET